MKKFLSLIMSFALILTITPFSHAASQEENLVDAVWGTLKSPNIQGDVDAAFRYGNNELLSFDANFQDSQEKFKSYFKTMVDVDSEKLPQSAQQELDGVSFKIDAFSAYETYWDKNKGDVFSTLKDISLKVKSPNEEVNAMADIIGEVLKFFNNRTFLINIKDLSSDLSELLPYAQQDEFSELFENITKEDLAAIYEAIILGKILVIDSVSANKYTLKPTQDIKDINIDAIITAVKKISFISDEIIEEITEELSDLSMGDIRRMNADLENFFKFVDISVVVVTSGNKVQTVDMNISANLQELINEDIDEISFQESVSLSYNNVSIQNTTKDAETVNLTKIIHAAKVLSEASVARFNKYYEKEYNDDYGYDEEEYDYGYEEVEPVEEMKVRIKSKGSEERRNEIRSLSKEERIKILKERAEKIRQGR